MEVKHKGVWRSYKTFCFNGAVRQHSGTSYSELAISGEGVLTLRSFTDPGSKAIYPSGCWEIRDDEKRRRFLYLEEKRSFEEISFDASDVVLQDPANGDKIFFAELAQWASRLQPGAPADSNLYICLWSNSLIQLVKVE